MKKTIFLSLVFLIILSTCKNDSKQEAIEVIAESDYTMEKLSTKRPNLNVSLLLDLSDRIDPKKYPDAAMDFYRRDIGHIKSVSQAFEIHLRNKRSITINDKLQLFLNPEPSDKTLNEKVQLLKMSFTRDNATRNAILQTSKKYDSIVTLIYKNAIEDNNYVGSDTWRFFKNKVKDYCVEDDYRNVLVILTDGYVYHKDTKRIEGNKTTFIRPQDIRSFKLNNNNWHERYISEGYGFIPSTSGLAELEVLVLGVNPDKKNQYEEDVIIQYWSDWLASMGVINYQIKITDLPTNMDKLIKNFIHN